MGDNNKLTPYLFTVEVDGIETARFQKCSGLEAEIEVYEVEEGGLNTTTHKFPGRARYTNLILEKGVSDNDVLFNWHREMMTEGRKTARKNGSVVLKDGEGNEIKRWNFFRALPCRWTGPRLLAHIRGEFAVELLEIAHEGLEVDNNSLPQENSLPNNARTKTIHEAIAGRIEEKYIPKVYDCDVWIEDVLRDAGYDPLDYMAGSASSKNVDEHIANAAKKEGTIISKKNSAPDLDSGTYVVYMGDSSLGLISHAGILVVGSDGNATIIHNSSINGPNGGVGSEGFSSIQDFQNEYGYNTFCYQGIED